MDYDDDDTQENNLQLAGEGRCKSSSVLRPYAFPRFDFDDSLPGHLRFDSLVETEVFLGIQGQEDNQWIEDYSKGNNVIEFSSSATDSCSVSRRNNVWSEATSSESVEMLLKSVVQEQIVHSESVINSSYTCNDLDRLAKKMETIRDEDIRSSGYSRISDDTLPPNELLRSIPALKDDVEGDALQVQGTSLLQKSLAPAHDNASHLGANVPEEKFEAHATDRNIFVESECGDKSGKEAQCFVGEPLNCRTDHAGPPRDIESRLGILDSAKSPKEMKDHSPEGTNGLSGGINDGMKDQLISSDAKADTHVLEHPAVGDAWHTTGSSICHASNVDNGNSDEAIPNLCIESTEMSSMEESKFWLPKESGKDASCIAPIQPEACGANGLATGAMIIDANRIDDPVAVGTEQHDTEMCNPSEGLCPCSELKRDSDIQLPHGLDDEKLGNLAESMHKEDNEVTGSISELSPVKGETDEHTADKIDNINNVDVDKSFDLSLTPEELISEMDGTKSVKDITDVSAVNAEEPRSFSGLGNVSVIKEDHSKFSVDILNINSTSATTGTEDWGMGSSVLVKSVTLDKKVVDDIQPETVAKVESESDDLPTERSSGLVDANKVDTGAEPSAADVSGLDGKGETASKMSMDASLSTLGRTDQVTTEVGRVTDAEFVQNAAAGPQLSESNEKSPPAVKEIESQAAVSNLSEDLPKGFGSHPDQHEKNLNRIGSGDASYAKSQEDALMVIEGERKSPSAADDLEVACGSPTIINSGDPSQDEGYKQQEARGSEVADEFAETEQCISEDPKVKDATEDDNSFTFKVNSLPEVAESEKGNSWTPFSIAETYEPFTVVEQKVVEVLATPDMEKIDASLPLETFVPHSAATTAGVEKTQAKLLQESPGQSPNVSDGELAGRSSKGASGRRGRRASGKGTAKDNSSKVNSQKETTPSKSSRKVDKLPIVLPSPSGSTLPALNTSCSPPTPPFQQPFTDLQQVQLRAQIFVYGSLIQGTAPEEACMVSAFGPSDAGRNMWESVWRAAVERVHSQKSQSSVETPVHTAGSFGTFASDVAAKQGSQQSKVISSPASQGGSRGAPTPILNPIIPLSSPLWDISTPRGHSQSGGMQRGSILEYQPTISPLHPYQTPPVRSFIGHPAWPSQPAFPPSPWASQMSALNASAHFSTAPIAEPVKLNTVKDSPLLPSSGMKNISTSHMLLPSDPSLVFTGVSSSLPEQPMGISLSLLPSADPKPRRRKKSQASNDISQSPLISQGQTEPEFASPMVTTTFSLIAVTAPVSDVAKSATIVSPVCSVSPVSSFPQSKIGDLDTGKSATCSVETWRKESEAKLQAEEAASLAASALSHSESVWCELSKQKESGTSSEAEAKISSAAVAVAAAASVAKAAAAAARVASNAALQAKLMAEEALLSSGNEHWSQHGILFSDVRSMGKRDDVCGQPGSVIMAAREAAKRRIQAATAAAKQAENLDAIVKAAELAAEAVSQAGKIVAMGDPLPLKELIKAGPEGYWKLPQASSELAVKLGNKNNEQINISAKETEGGSSDVKDASDHGKTPSRDMLSDSLDNHIIADGISQSIASGKNDVNKRHNISDIAETSGVVPMHETNSGTGPAQECEKRDLLHGNSIHKDSLVEVYKHGDGLKPAWFSARVLALEDGKAFVSYFGLLSNGSENLKEWVALEGEKGEAPRIRAAPASASHSQATKKRRRTSMGDYTWNVGDRVDVQFQDCWWEGVVTENNEKDETTLTVHFPDRGETSAVRSWQLRPSLIWNDGKWAEWSRLKGHDHYHEGDMPHGKRQKFGSPFAVSNLKDKLPRAFETRLDRPEKLKSFALSSSEKVFNVGKNTKEDNKTDAHRTLRTALQKEGSKVVFGVPKPGKKRKFMEVSKHYSSDSNMTPARNNKNQANDSVKFAKYLMPQATVPRGWKSFSKADSKGKQTAPRAANSRKPPATTRGTMLLRAKSLKSDSAKNVENFTDQVADIDDSEVHGDYVSEKRSSADRASSGTEEVKEGPLSSLFPNQLGKLSSSSAKSERLYRGKLGPLDGKLTKIEEDKVFNGKTGKTAPEAVEPRRSRRRIQPTHRLLEGLQSSLIIPKMSSVSHDKGHRSQSRSTTGKGK